MKVVSCIPVAFSEQEASVDDLVLCECDLREEKFPESEVDLGRLTIHEIVVSEGNEIHRRRDFGCGDLQVFSGSEDEKRSLQRFVWFELVKLLTGHRIQVDSLNGRVKFTRWVCDAPEGKQWNLIMELESEGIVRKIAQLGLESVSHGEVDLFQMTNMLFQSFCQSNDTVGALRARELELESSIATLTEQREILDRVLLQRDEKTRTIVVNLLNEKKKRIAMLEQEVRKEHSSMNLCDISDSEVINQNVKDAVSHLISPGKRKYRATQAEKDRKKAKRRLFPEPKVEPQDDFEDDFKFFGITKPREENTPSSSSTPKKPNVKQESQEDRITELDSQRSDPMRDSIEDNSGAETETDTITEYKPVIKHETPEPHSDSESDTDASLPEDDSS